MRSFVLLLLALATLCTQSFAQEQSEYAKLQKQGVDAINAGHFEEGIASFKKCFEIVPEDGTTAYNLGCCYSKKAEKDTAFEWLDKAANWGFGNQSDGSGVPNIEFCQKDTDLTALHDDPRWAKFIEKMTKGRKALEDYCASAAVYIPKALDGAAELPLLVVLHAENKTKNSVIEGRWKGIADSLGCALIAPSGKYLSKGLDPSAGMQWFDSPVPYSASPRSYERPVSDALAAFQKDHKLAADRVFIAGEGIGGMLAFNIALTKAGSYKGVVVVDGLINERLASSRVPAAAKAGLRVHLIESKAGLVKYFGKENAQSWLDGIPKKLSDWGLAAKVETFELKEGTPDPSDAIVMAALKSFSAPAPVEAGAGK